MRGGAGEGGRLFYHGFDRDIKETLLKQMCAVWTHDSTSIEGNTLTLGETFKVLELGLTIQGKPLREHQEVYGHAQAIELIYGMLSKGAIGESEVFDLHKAVMPLVAADIMNPVGGWKREYNGATGLVDGRVKYMEYAAPERVATLMAGWMKRFNELLKKSKSGGDVLDAYLWAHISFVRIHPFFDGNGRMARLLANLPVLLGGEPPIVLPKEARERYIGLLWEYQSYCGLVERGDEPLVEHEALGQFREILLEGWQVTRGLVAEARERQEERVG